MLGEEPGSLILLGGKFVAILDELILTCRLGSDRYKTKTVYETLNPRWLEQFDMYLYEDQDQDLDITVWDKDQRSKDDFMGR